MYLDGRKKLHRRVAINRLPRWLTLLFPFSIIGSVFGQNYLVPPQGFQGSPGIPTMGNVNPTAPTGNTASAPSAGQTKGEASTDTSGTPSEGESGSATKAVAAPVENLMQWGALHLHARASYQFSYATGIHSSPGQPADTYSHTITPGIDINVGPHVTLSYSPSLRFYSQSDFHDTVDHYASLDAHAGYGDWSFATTHSFALSDDPMIQTSGQTEEQNYLGAISASYQFNDRISFDTGGNVGFVWVNGTNIFIGPFTNSPPVHLGNSQNYGASEWVSYQVDENISTSAGFIFGYNTQEGGFNSVFEQYEGRVSWRPGEKLSMTVTGGVQDRQFLNTGSPDEVHPVFNATASYHLFDQTILSLSADRSVQGALFQKQIEEITVFGLGLQQRLFGQVQLSLGFGYTTADYRVTSSTVATVRSDSSTSYSAALTIPFLKRCSFSTYYAYTQNASSLTGYGFSSSQTGMTLSWAY